MTTPHEYVPAVTARTSGLRGRLSSAWPVGLPFIHHYFPGHRLPAAPATFDLTGGFTRWGMLGNGPDPTLTVNGGNPVGDCAFAGFAHLLMLFATATGLTVPGFTSDEVVTEYLRYNHGRDQGANLLSLLSFAEKVGLLGSKVLGFAQLPLSDPETRWNGVYLFKGGYTGIAEPAPADGQFAGGRPWDLTGTAADRQIVGGHCVIDCARLNGGGVDITWGADQAFTDRWDRVYRQEVVVVVTGENAELAAKGGMDVDAWLADLKRIAA